MSDTQWHLSKSVSISTMAALAVLAMGGIGAWFDMKSSVGVNQSAIASNKKRIEQQDMQIENMRNAAQIQAVQLGRIETSIEAMRKSLESIETELRNR